MAAKGSFVAEKNTEIIREEHLKQIEEYMRTIVKLAPSCNLTEEDLVFMLRLIIKEG